MLGFAPRLLQLFGLGISSLRFADHGVAKVKKGQRASLGVPARRVLTGGRCAACAWVNRGRGARGASGR